MEYLHTMLRISDPEASLRFFCEGLGLKQVHRKDVEAGRFTLYFLAAPQDIDRAGGLEEGESPLRPGVPMVELTHNWDEAGYDGGRNFGHLAFNVDDIYATCAHLQAMGYVIARPPRDGRMAFVRSPDAISVELLQKDGAREPQEPWASMSNSGSW